jgi:tRNA(Ile)-lysidine synthase
MVRSIEKKIEDYNSTYHLWKAYDNIIVGVSGGADSMALLHYLHKKKEKYHLNLQVAHVHHGIREDADKERDFVIAYCKSLGLPCAVSHCHIPRFAKDKGISQEEAGRLARYEFFASLAHEKGKIAVAHHKDDQVETMLMRFLRGSDIKGLGGMLPKRGQIIRPFLCIGREDIEAYCEKYNIPYCQDNSNFMPIYTRNKLRLVCIPYIKENINPNLADLLFEHSKLYQEEEEFLHEYVLKVYANACKEQTKKNIEIGILELQKEKPYIQKRILYYALTQILHHGKNITLHHIESIYALISKQPGKKICLPQNIVCLRGYETLCLKYETTSITTLQTKIYPISLGQNIFGTDKKLILSLVTRKTFEQREENSYTKYIDYDKIKDSLCIRTRQTEDYITLLCGTKKIKKYFIDQKIPREQRSHVALLADGCQIIWVVGDRLNSAYYVDERTKNILEIKLEPKQKNQEELCYI